ncbi:ACT domain-containing protein [Shewanella kaireitica]|uniref:ACT domain-containing protein n=1 Tax=Shewanella kaireitica TaxID=212021 RepID=UPI00200C307D|nr:ACT domain-containing protein [Shewanella kaireitica]MCL1092676.1 transcriptional regulator [Shewanella kaireitica]
MKKMFIATVLGEVTPGVIKALAQLTRESGGEWITSKVIKVDHHFAALLKIAIEEKKAEQLKAMLKSQFPKLNLMFESSNCAELHNLRAVNFNVDCKDRPGLTRDIVDVLVNLDLAIEHMEFNRVHVSVIGETMFTSKLTVLLPIEVSNASVLELLEGVSEGLRASVI